ncbi:hypothetical protein DRE_02340 [Drechslerella stenobrocha 248]|uniref:VOC domain-containing protein n=1 Tax=Drechslerella stenobrocha 248 TaxID=1043628 RepID=W7HVM2_9PEZI|nr:hypothetical protein DRE_02340 [Drechslerella stenobrocha 248]
MQIYIEIQASDCPRAIAFYTSIFPLWRFSTTPEPGLPIVYHRGYFSSPSAPGEPDPAFPAAINILQRPAPAPPTESGTNAFVCSFPVPDEAALDELEGKVVAGGGQVALPKFPVPGRGWHGYFVDTEGNTFGVFTTEYRNEANP